MLESFKTIKQVKQSMVEWGRVRQEEEDRRRSLTGLGRSTLHRWETNGPHSKQDAEFVHEQVAKVVSILNESSERGKRNNENFAKCTEDLSATRRLKSDEKMAALLKLHDECLRVLREDLPQRSMTLDRYEKEVNALVAFINDRLTPTIAS
ncbi:MAG: hypothetical protein ACYC1I_05475 [Acidimicrobiales bacterium]